MPEATDGTQGDPGANDNAGGQQGDGQQQQQGDLGDAGKRAIEAERAARKQAEKRLGDMEKELARIRESGMSEQEKAVEQAKREAKADAMKAFNARLLQAEVRAVATGKLSDPEDALLHLDLNDFSVDDDGKTDRKAIEKAVGDLLKAKPYLAASATRPTGDADQGARGTTGSGSSMNDLIRSALRR